MGSSVKGKVHLPPSPPQGWEIIAMACWMTENSLWCHMVGTFWKSALWNLPEIFTLGCWGKLFMGWNLTWGTLLQSPPRSGKLLAAGCCRPPCTAGNLLWRKGKCLRLGKPYVLQELGAGKLPMLQEPEESTQWNKEVRKFFLGRLLVPSMTKLQVHLAKEKKFKGPEPFSQSKNKGEFGAKAINQWTANSPFVF